jgi:hypothetical protein
MFSPSLISMMLHCLPVEVAGIAPDGRRQTFRTMDDVAKFFESVKVGPSLPIPVIGRSSRELREIDRELPHIPEDQIADFPDSDRYFWGRFGLDALIRFFLTSYRLPADVEYVDLGTPVILSGSGSLQDTECARLLQDTQTSGALAARVAIIDLGDNSFLRDDYGQKLSYAGTGTAALSSHAEAVLAVLLKRLEHHSDRHHGVAVSCALVVEPPSGLKQGKSCFRQHSAAEMMTAVNALHKALPIDGIPAAVNMSLGTHVGPHNGQSTLEAFISRTLAKNDRVMVAAAGNDDQFGRSASCELQADTQGSLTLVTGPQCQELLVELWWKDPTPGSARQAEEQAGGSLPTNLRLEAEIWEVQPGGTRTRHKTLHISRTSGTRVLRPRGAFGGMMAQTLFAARCRGGFSCAAFALSGAMGTVGSAPLPPMQIFIKMTAPQDTTVNAWLVVCENEPITSLINHEKVGTVIVPATDESVVSVAGVSKGKVWNPSSRGPGAQYDASAQERRVPLMAHNVDSGVSKNPPGTSFASPRACADIADGLAKQKSATPPQPVPSDAEAVIRSTYGCTTGANDWNERTGFHTES